MRFWDSSAITPTFVEEPSSGKMRALVEDGSTVGVWWGTIVECTSAVARRERSGDLTPEDALDALVTLDRLAEEWAEIPPTDRLRDDARRVIRVHDLRAADAYQLAAARAACDDHPETLPFVTLDDRLALAASREGFPVLGLG
ncbi:MAG: type II toxin-antitoxin system VapC family toxin [Thermoleophilia bacterium]|nr:type II toxin-antitoxin system VapC family toxin [Thermoleophilia bacterium]